MGSVREQKMGLSGQKLRMYLSHAYDVLSGVTKNLCYSPALNEIANAIQMIGSFESNCTIARIARTGCTHYPHFPYFNASLMIFLPISGENFS